MKWLGTSRAALLGLLLFGCICNNVAQGTIFFDVRAFVSAPLPMYHVDEFLVTASKPIREFEARILINPMNHVQPDGSLTVFPTGLSPADADRDSHFVFDISSATVRGQYEDSSELRVSVEYHSDYPTSFRLARAVVADSHSPYEAHILGTFLDGEMFGTSIVFVPEPSMFVLAALGLLVFCLFPRHRGQ